MALIGFNVGVEIGQLAIVSVFVPLAYHFRQTTAYRTFALRGGSVVVIAVAAIWMAERMFDFRSNFTPVGVCIDNPRQRLHCIKTGAHGNNSKQTGCGYRG